MIPPPKKKQAGEKVKVAIGRGGSWRRSIVVRTLVSAGELSLSCARLLVGWFVVKPSAVGQPTWPTQPSIPQGS